MRGQGEEKQKRRCAPFFSYKFLVTSYELQIRSFCAGIYYSLFCYTANSET